MKSDRQIIWPAYLDATKSRGQGRIISKKRAVEEPTLKEIREAADELGVNPEIQPEKSHPKSWWEESGRVLIDRNGPNTVVAKRIAEKIKKSR